MTDTQRTDLSKLLSARRAEIIAAAERHRGRRIRVFGSVARSTHSAESDVDFLVDFDSGSSLFDLMHLQEELEELLGRSVDVISTGGLKGRDERILLEAVDI